MKSSTRRLVVAVVFVVAALAGFWFARQRPPAPVVSVVLPVLRPASLPATVPDPPFQPRTYVEVVQGIIPDFPTTQSLGVPLEWPEAARIIFPRPVHLNPPPRSDVWLTDPNALTLSELWQTKEIERQQTFVVRETILHVHWLNPQASDEPSRPVVVVRQVDGHAAFMDANGNVIGAGESIDDLDWTRAEWFDNQLVVPGAGGARVISFSPQFEQRLVTVGPASSKVWTCVDAGGGLLAWATGDGGSVARFAKGEWSTLDTQAGWSPRAAQLVPLLDGSVLQIAFGPPGEEDAVELKLIPLVGGGGAKVDERRLAALVEQLSDLSQARREAATEELSRYGPEAWPVLEKLIVDQPPEVMMRMKRVMGDRLQPTLAGMKLVDGRMKLVTRLSDGGCVFYASSGVSIARRDGNEDVVAPAWIAVRPGRPIARLPDALVVDLRPDHAPLEAIGREWIVHDDVRGPLRLLGNRLVTLLRPAERESGFDRVAGIDRRGRWLFRRHADASGTGPTLIVDPTLPDPTPKLPAWTFAETKEVGWTDDDWPAVRKGNTWTLREAGWQLVDEKQKDALCTERPPAPQAWAALAHQASSSTRSTTTPLSVEERLGPAILTTSDGTRFFDGYAKLIIVRPDGTDSTWPLPAEVVGRPPFPVVLLRTVDGHFFLFNQPGRVIRLRPGPDTLHPFQIEATFTQGIPTMDAPARIWLDPAGRIIFVGDNKLTLLFPTGQIPTAIRNLMTGASEEMSP